jgi:hypothetical protein
MALAYDVIERTGSQLLRERRCGLPLLEKIIH